MQQPGANLSSSEGEEGELPGWQSRTASMELGNMSNLDDDHTEGEARLAKDPQSTSFFQRGREWEGRTDIHKYTNAEKQILQTFDSFDYLPPHSTAYKVWLRNQPQRFEWDRWVMMGMIGFTTGFVGFLLHQLIDVISDTKWERIREYVSEDNLGAALGWAMWYSLLFTLLSTVLVVVFRPAAAGSGIPELIGFLNGTSVAAIFNVKTMFVKFWSCVFSVSSGLPVGPEGPMIHLGALIGAGLSQFRSRTLHLETPFFTRFRNSEDRRNFISAGAGAGISSAFGAPVGGLLFAMEEVSSFWNLKLGWQTFFCTMVSAFTTDLFNSCFDKFVPKHTFGQFFSSKYILFDVSLGININLLLFIPAAIIGIIGGISGALFTFGNVKVSRARRWVQGKFKRRISKMIVKMLEPLLIMAITVAVVILLPGAFNCTAYHCGLPEGYSCANQVCHRADNASAVSPRCLDSHPLSPRVNQSESRAVLEPYVCPTGVNYSFEGNGTTVFFSNSSYNQLATLLFGNGEQTVRHLFSRSTHLEFSAGPLATVLVIYFSLACWSAGSAISSGLVVPMLLIGALYGRLIGYGMVVAFGIFRPGTYWAWIDPGALALIGAASFFGGVSRLTMSLTVIMIEITNDVQFLLPLMVGVMFAKWTGDYLTHPLYHALLELKCIPFLDEEPVIVHAADQSGHHHSHGKSGPSNLELYTARHAMSSPCATVGLQEKVGQLARMLLFLQHSGFPVVRDEGGKQMYCGLITRQILLVLLSHGDPMFQRKEDLPTYSFEEFLENEPRTVPVPFEKMASGTLRSNRTAGINRLSEYAEGGRYDELYLDMMPYINQSQPSVPCNFSLHRTYIIFRTLGMRHMPVVDLSNQVLGIITRKDLMGFALEEKIAYHRHAQSHPLPPGGQSVINSGSARSAPFGGHAEPDSLSLPSGTQLLAEEPSLAGPYHLLTEFEAASK